MMRAKWCPNCEISWQTQRKTCYNCGHEFTGDNAFTISKGVAKSDLPTDNQNDEGGPTS